MATFPRTGMTAIDTASKATIRRYPRRHRKPCPLAGKMRWMTQLDAEVVVARMGNVGSAYWCPACWSWHVTRQPPSQP